MQDTPAFYIRIEAANTGVWVHRFHTRFPTLNMRSIIDTSAAASDDGGQSIDAADCCLLFAVALDYISLARYPPAMRGRMHVNANVHCLETGSRI